MARSYRKTPIRGITTAESDKPAKRCANRSLRTSVRRQLQKHENYDNMSITHLKEVSNSWTFPKDGKKFFNRSTYPDIMRK